MNSTTQDTRGATIFSISVIIGALCLTVTDALPGGFDGGAGFLLGTVVSFFALWVVSAREKRSTVEEALHTANTLPEKALPRDGETQRDGHSESQE